MIQGPASEIHAITGKYSSCEQYFLYRDQVGSVRCLATEDGLIGKYVEYDAFGNLIHETNPDFFFPLGFAGGLNDWYTGLVRFGFRDYDPWYGRFTSKDPMGDTGGDHDLWDYCVDDPINMTDSTGLWSEFIHEPWVRKVAGKTLGRFIAGQASGIGWVFSPDRASEPEAMYAIRRSISEIENRVANSTASKEDKEKLGKLQRQEDELWEKFGGRYASKAYEDIFPDKEYIQRKIKDAGQHR